MDSYLNKDAVIEASSVINDSLMAKGYIKTTLLFNSINWEELKKGQPTELPNLLLTDTIYNNDKNIINIIYSLNQSVERNKVQNKTFNQIINQKDQDIKNLSDKLQSLESKLSKYENMLATNEQERLLFSKRNSILETENKAKSKDLSKVKNWCNDIKVKHEIELKKKNNLINGLKDQLIERKHLSTSMSYGIGEVAKRFPSTESKDTTEYENDHSSKLVYNNNPILNSLNDTNLPVPILNAEYEKIVITLTDLTNNLIKENHKFSRFVKYLNRYYLKFNQVINPDSNPEELPNPEDFFNFNELNHLVEEDIDIDNIETFEFIIKPILNNIYKNYHYLNNLFDEIDHIRLEVPLENNEFENDEIQRLKEELEVVTQNWNDAIKTLENWKIRHQK